VFDTKFTYTDILKAIRTGQGLASTIEFFPEEGKYHYDGHRACNVSMVPSETVKLNNRCPVCDRALTIGVMHRVEQLADRPEGEKRPGAKPFQHLIPLSEIIASRLGTAVAAKKVFAVHADLMKAFGDEFNVLLDATRDAIAKVTDDKLAELIIADREQRIPFKPGYDGVFGYPDFSAYGVPGMTVAHPAEDAETAAESVKKADKAATHDKNQERKTQKSLGEF